MTGSGDCRIMERYMLVKGGYPYYGYKIGILVLDSQIPRIPGDLGNATTYDFPVTYKVVRGASIERVVNGTDPALLKPFIDAAKELEAEGCKAITTSCGFLAIFQKELAAAVNIPVFTSSLIQVKFVSMMLSPGKKVGVIVSEPKNLSKRHLDGVGISDIPMVIKGVENSCFIRATHTDNPSFDPDLMREQVVEAAKELVASDPDVGAIVLECTNLPPYAQAVQRATGLPVFDIITLINYVHSAIVQKEYTGHM